MMVSDIEKMEELHKQYVEYFGEKKGTRLTNFFFDKGTNEENKMLWCNIFLEDKFELKKAKVNLDKLYDIYDIYNNQKQRLESLDIWNKEELQFINDKLDEIRLFIKVQKKIMAETWRNLERSVLPYLSGLISDDEFASLIGTNVLRVREARKQYDMDGSSSGNFLSDAIAIYFVEADQANGMFATAFRACMMELYHENKEYREIANQKMTEMFTQSGVVPYTATTDSNGNITGFKQNYPKPQLVH